MKKELTRKEKIKYNKRNTRIYPFYRMISTDYLFYYAIEFVFLTQVKGISAGNVVLLGSIYSFFVMLFQIPIIMLLDKIRK